MNSNKKISRRSFLKKWGLTSAGLIGLVGSPLGYAHFVERFRIEIKEVQLTLKRLPSSFSGLRLLHFSDTHIGYFFDHDDMLNVVNLINNLKPDIICFTGDLFERKSLESEHTTKVMSQLKAKLGKFAVLGNHDYWINWKEVTRILENSGFMVLNNRNHPISNDHADMIQFAGVTDVIYGKPNLKLSLQGIEPSEFTIMLAHEPDYADKVGETFVDLQLSGHTHGGQVRIPGVGHIFVPKYGEKYVQGLYQVPKSNLLVYTNRGIGTSNLPYRFFCRPEITVFTLNNEVE